jgi:hypothetical protein
VKYDRSDAFKSDYKDLDVASKAMFRAAVPLFVEGAELAAAGSPHWHPTLRVKGVKGAAGIYEMTWNFKRPDGRATWQWTEIDGEPAIQWRRIGGHEIFSSP